MKKLTQSGKAVEFAVYPKDNPAWLKEKIGSLNYNRIDTAYTNLLRAIARDYCNVKDGETADGGCENPCEFEKVCPYGDEGFYYIDNFLRRDMPPSAGGSRFTWAHTLLRKALMPTLLLPNYDDPSADRAQAKKLADAIIALINGLAKSIKE